MTHPGAGLPLKRRDQISVATQLFFLSASGQKNKNKLPPGTLYCNNSFCCCRNTLISNCSPLAAATDQQKFSKCNLQGKSKIGQECVQEKGPGTCEAEAGTGNRIRRSGIKSIDK